MLELALRLDGTNVSASLARLRGLAGGAWEDGGRGCQSTSMSCHGREGDGGWYGDVGPREDDAVGDRGE